MALGDQLAVKGHAEVWQVGMAHEAVQRAAARVHAELKGCVEIVVPGMNGDGLNVVRQLLKKEVVPVSVTVGVRYSHGARASFDQAGCGGDNLSGVQLTSLVPVFRKGGPALPVVGNPRHTFHVGRQQYSHHISPTTLFANIGVAAQFIAPS